MKETVGQKDIARYAAARKALGLSLEGLARKLGRSLSTTQRYAGGKSKIPQATLELMERWVREQKKRSA